MLRVVPSFEAVGRWLEASNPLLVWSRMMEAAWSPWVHGLTGEAHVEDCASIYGSWAGLSRRGGQGVMPTENYLPSFATRQIETAGARIHLATGGSGAPLLLLHGHPQTHLTWHKIAPRLAKRFTVVAPDLRGYGDSAKPDGGERHVNYSKRAMAADQVEVMGALGFERFAVVGHDRGGRVAHRMVLSEKRVVLWC